MASVKTRNGNVSGDLKVPRYLKSPSLQTVLNNEGFLSSTGLKTRGYLTSRFDFVQIAHARHSPSKLDSALS